MSNKKSSLQPGRYSRALNLFSVIQNYETLEYNTNGKIDLFLQYNNRNKFQYLALSCIGAIKQAVRSVERRLLLELGL